MQTKEQFLNSMPIGYHTIGGKQRYYSREEWEDFYDWWIAGRDEDENVSEVQQILNEELA